MDYFTKNKMLFWCVIILVILNVVTLSSFWMGKSGPAMQKRPGGQRDGQKIMTEKLQLSDQQAQEFEQIRNEHFMRTRRLQDDMHKIRLDMLDETFELEPDDLQIEKLLSELGEMQNQFEKNLFQHFQELKDACNEQQREQLQLMLRNLIDSTRPGKSRGRQQGSDGDKGPNRRPPPRR